MKNENVQIPLKLYFLSQLVVCVSKAQAQQLHFNNFCTCEIDFLPLAPIIYIVSPTRVISQRQSSPVRAPGPHSHFTRSSPRHSPPSNSDRTFACETYSLFHAVINQRRINFCLVEVSRPCTLPASDLGHHDRRVNTSVAYTGGALAKCTMHHAPSNRKLPSLSLYSKCAIVQARLACEPVKVQDDSPVCGHTYMCVYLVG